MKVLPTLFKKTRTSALQYWTISSFDSTIQTAYGQVGGKEQVTTDIIREGKNLGRSNETSPAQQAQAEAEAKWEKQIKKGYVEDRTRAEAGENDFVGGVSPMLAPTKPYPTDKNLAKKIAYPAYMQPKLDGARCIVSINHGVVSLWTRTRKPIYCVPHIVEAYTRLKLADGNWDGELYNHEYRHRFEDLMSIIRQQEPDAEGLYRVIQHHVYDIVIDEPYRERLARLTDSAVAVAGDPIVLVPTFKVETVEEAKAFQTQFEDQGYEGGMIRNANGPYESGRRSNHLQKMKSFFEGEFKIVGVEEGSGHDAGTVGAFVCVTEAGVEFKARLMGARARCRDYFEHPEKWQNKMLTVKYKRFTADGSLYLPTAKGLRDYE